MEDCGENCNLDSSTVDGIGKGEQMNHAKWVEKVAELEGRWEEIKFSGDLGPVQLGKLERILNELEKCIGEGGG